MQDAVESTIAPVFQLKGGMYTLTAIQLLSTDFTHLAHQLHEKVMQAPKFFCNAPIVLDLQKVAAEGVKIDFKTIKKIIRDNKLFPIAVRGGTQQQQTAAVVAGMAVLPEGRQDFADEQPKLEVKKAAPPVEASEKAKPNSGTTTKLIKHPVRSGQQIYAQGGDLIIMAAVSHGAELLADGNIHVYGPLRGRALAGITGNETAAIYCQSLEAELVSVAGQYRVCEDLKNASMWKQAAFVHLDHERLKIDAL